MTDRISIGHLYPNPASPMPSMRTPVNNQSISISGKQSFQNILQDNIVRFSHHAEVRLQQRGIELKQDQLAKIESAIDKAAAKGAKDSLMLLGGMALIVNIPNRTVVTALDGSSIKDNVFTQIDSAVIIS